MNWRKGITRLLIVLLYAVGVVAILTQLEGFTLRGIVYFVVLWLALLLSGVVIGCFILYLGKLISHLFRAPLNKEEREGEKGSKKTEGGFRELAWVTSVITSAIAFFVVPLTSYSKKMEPDYSISFLLGLVIVLITFCLVWAFYIIVLFVVRGFTDDGQKQLEEC